MTGIGEVALFVDFENIRYGLRRYNQEPVIPQLMEKARKYGTVAVALAYADFSDHPDWVRRQMDIAGISARDVPLRRFFNNGVERVKSSADLHMVMDIMETVLDRPHVHTYVLMAGDSDYIRVTTWLRNRFARKVVISGVPGSISSDLVLAAGFEDPVEPMPEMATEKQEAVIASLIEMIHRRDPPLGFWTVRLILDWARDRRNNIPANEVATAQAVTTMVQEQMLVREVQERNGREVTVASLNYEHPRVTELIETFEVVEEEES
ncbi:MAG: NYN domain-containing protein [Dehalococcoidia bacterium]